MYLPIIRNVWIQTQKKRKMNVTLTLTLLTWRIGWSPNNASKWWMGFNSAFKGLTINTVDSIPQTPDSAVYMLRHALTPWEEQWSRLQYRLKYKHLLLTFIAAAVWHCSHLVPMIHAPPWHTHTRVNHNPLRGWLLVIWTKVPPRVMAAHYRPSVVPQQ